MAHPQVFMDRLREALEASGLHDLGYVRDPFTWRNNSHEKDKYIPERLDRVVPGPAWCTRFLGYKVVHGDLFRSDHIPIIIHLEGVN